jgi:hypothetical protein
VAIDISAGITTSVCGGLTGWAAPILAPEALAALAALVEARPWAMLVAQATANATAAPTPNAPARAIDTPS